MDPALHYEVTWLVFYDSYTFFLDQLSNQQTVMRAFEIFLEYDFRAARQEHTAWTPSSQPDSIVLMAGEDSAAELSAEIVPGNQGRSDCRIMVIMKFTTHYIYYDGLSTQLMFFHNLKRLAFKKPS